MKRRSIKKDGETQYLEGNRPPDSFISSGCAVLDCVLGGGYPMGRIVNIVGDKSTGKTLLAIEASANFSVQFPDGLIWYAEVEAAFDKGYAATLGLPVDRVNFVDGIFTVEDLFTHMSAVIKECQSTKSKGLYIIDSLDALSDKAELERDISDGSYGAAKAKKMSELFRRLIQLLEKSHVAVLIISQVRDAIGVSFGEKHTRSGGKALDFYASQALWLSQIGTIKRTIKGVERPIALNIRAKCKKNKIGPPLRDCEFELRFGFGIDDIAANANWLDKVGMIGKIGLAADKYKRWLRALEDKSDEEYQSERKRIAEVTKEVWKEVEKGFMPTRRKY